MFWQLVFFNLSLEILIEEEQTTVDMLLFE